MMFFRLAGAFPLLMAAACATWLPYEGNPKLQPDQSLPFQLRATRSDSSRVSLNDPFVRADSLYGRTRGDTVGLPLTDIVRLERSRISAWRTAAVVVGVPAVGFGLAYLVLCGSGECEPDYVVLPAALLE